MAQRTLRTSQFVARVMFGNCAMPLGSNDHFGPQVRRASPGGKARHVWKDERLNRMPGSRRRFTQNFQTIVAGTSTATPHPIMMISPGREINDFLGN